MSVYIENIVRGFSRYHKYTIKGEKRSETPSPLEGEGRGEGYAVIKYDYPLLEHLRATLASYLGHLKWADSYNLRSAIFKKYGFLREYFSLNNPLPPFSKGEYLDKGRTASNSPLIKGDRGLLSLYRYPEIFPSVKSQYLYYACRFRDMVIFFQVGCFYEFYGGTKDEVKDILSLKRLKNNQRGAMYGFPVRLVHEYLKRLIDKGFSVIIIKETDRYIGRIKERLPAMKIMKNKMDSPIESWNDGVWDVCDSPLIKGEYLDKGRTASNSPLEKGVRGVVSQVVKITKTTKEEETW